MSNAITEFFTSCTIERPRTAGGLTVFGLRHARPSKLEYTTLDEALADQSVAITEISVGGSVPTLQLTNKSGRRLFLLAGEQLIGAKQNRILNTSLLIEVGAEMPIPVSCVEQGRWSYRSPKFESRGTAAHGKLRATLSRQVSESYLACAAPASNQAEVWNEVSRKSTTLGSRSPSMALSDVYDDHRASLDKSVAELECPADCAGVVFARNGQVVAADIFDQPTTLGKLWSKLIRAQLLDAIEEPNASAEVPEPAAVRRWLDSAATAEAKSFQSPALGEDVRLQGRDVVGAGLVVENQPVHVQVFAQP